MKKTQPLVYIIVLLFTSCQKENIFREQLSGAASGVVFVYHVLHTIPLQTMQPGTRANYDQLLLAREQLGLWPFGKNDTLGFTDVIKPESLQGFQLKLNTSNWSPISENRYPYYFGVVAGNVNQLQTRWKQGFTSHLVYIPKILKITPPNNLKKALLKKSPFQPMNFTWEPDFRNQAEQLIVDIHIQKSFFTDSTLLRKIYLHPDNGIFQLDSLVAPYNECYVHLTLRRFSLHLLDRKSGLLLEASSAESFGFWVTK